MLYSKDEIQAKNNRRGVMLLVLLGLLVLGTITLTLYNEFKPLPQTEACERSGYEGGNVINGFEYCYDGCADNKLTSCETRGTPR